MLLRFSDDGVIRDITDQNAVWERYVIPGSGTGHDVRVTDEVRVLTPNEIVDVLYKYIADRMGRSASRNTFEDQVHVQGEPEKLLVRIVGQGGEPRQLKMSIHENGVYKDTAVTKREVALAIFLAYMRTLDQSGAFAIIHLKRAIRSSN